MKFSSVRSAIVIAGVVAGSVIPSQAFAQTPIDVFASFDGGIGAGNGFIFSDTYKFNGSMILNGIGFLTGGYVPTTLSYSIGTTTYNLGPDFTVGQLSTADSYGMQYLSVTPRSMVENDVVIVNTHGGYGGTSTITAYRSTPSVNPSANVSYQGQTSNYTATYNTSFTSSNLRVSNPGSNVAPEPGTFALALTGGAALLGMCIRRRRNAA
jgi:hypothetical protein